MFVVKGSLVAVRVAATAVTVIASRIVASFSHSLANYTCFYFAPLQLAVSVLGAFLTR